MKKEFLIGSYAPKGSSSIAHAILDTQERNLKVEAVNSEAENPSWIILHPNGKVLYAVEERVPKGGFAVFQKDGADLYVVKHFSAGSAPCHLSLDGKAEFLFVSNYMDGTLDVWRLDTQGIPIAQTQHVQHEGHGTNAIRQEGPHIHSTMIKDEQVYVADLGTDQVLIYHLDRENGKLQKQRSIRFPDGCGPRHMAVHPEFENLIYVNAEMSGDVFVINAKTGSILQKTSLIPADYQGELRVSAIRFTENTLYVAARECDEIALFHLKPDGLLGEPSIYRHAQRTPRDVWMDQHWCITADEGSMGLTLLSREGKALSQVCFVETPQIRPTCILPLENCEK